MLPVRVVTDQLDPADEAYWIDMPARLTVLLPRFRISTKSRMYVAPAFPPPPYTWLMTRFGDPVAWAGGACRVSASREMKTAPSVVRAVSYTHLTLPTSD